jgi:hypothetical protein
MLCQNVVKQTHEELEPPLDSDARADLLIAVESLALETIDLLHTTRAIVWGDPLPYPFSQGLEEEEDDD